jgi:protein subunit release factor B
MVENIDERLRALGVKPEDLIEKFIRASGPGGQKVNKSSVAVYLKHVPTGVEVKAQSERSQALNRSEARKRLAMRLEAQIEEKRVEEEQQVEKRRRRNRKRSRKAKRAMRIEKRKQSEKKRLRSKVTEE